MGLYREISLAASILLVVGNIIGVGIFTTSGLIADEVGRSPWLIGVWILGGVLALIGATCYSVLARHIPKAGGEYAYLSPAYGALPAFLSGWASLLIGFSAPIAVAALAFGEYLEPYLAGADAGATHLSKVVVAILSIVGVSVFISLGLRFGAQLHSAVTLLNLALIVGFGVVVLWRSPAVENLTPVMRGSLLDLDPRSVGSALILVMFAYSGWNAAAYVAEEIRKPQRNIPAALILGTAAVMAAYVLVNLAYFGALPTAGLVGEIAVAKITASAVFGSVGTHFVNLLILSAILSSLTAMSIAGPRVYFAMSRDRLFPSWLSDVDPRRKLPLKAIWFQSAIAIVLVSIAGFREILYYSGTVLLFFATLTVSAIFQARPGAGKPAPFWFFYRLLPAIFVGVNSVILVSASLSYPRESLAGAITLAAGIPVYLYYRKRNGVRPGEGVATVKNL